MKPEEVLIKIKTEITDEKKDTNEKMIDDLVMNIFLKNMGYERIDGKNILKDRLQYNISNCFIISYYYELDVDKALSLLTKVIENMADNTWGMLLHKKGVWLLNNSIVTIAGEEKFKSDKIVFRIPFNQKIDDEYFQYFTHENLLIRKNTCFFRDMITYRNTEFKSKKITWNAYHTALKRFFSFYINNVNDFDNNNIRSSDKSNRYDEIKLSDFEQYVDQKDTIATVNSLKNQFFYVKDFIVKKTDNGEFDVSSNVVINRCEKILRKKMELEEVDERKIKKAIKYLEAGRNGLRDKSIFLILFYFGIERRNICMLRWNEDITNDCKMLKRGKREFIIPKYIQSSLKKLREEQPLDAIYIFGSKRTRYMQPMREGGINEILAKLTDIDENDIFYKLLTPANIRKWMFKYLLKNNWPMQNIINHMNITIDNIGNFVTKDEIWKYHIEGEASKENPLDKFMKDIEKL